MALSVSIGLFVIGLIIFNKTEKKLHRYSIMSDQFKHFIITRFNLKQNIWLSDKSGSDVNDEVWLENRYMFI